MDKSISVIIPAYNEEQNIQSAIESVRDVVGKYTADFELLVFDDGSIDRTAYLIETLAKADTRVRMIRNLKNRGLAYITREGIRLSQKNYLTWFPGDNSIDKDSLDPVFASIGKADIIVAYMANVDRRSWLRRSLSRAFTKLFNTLFGLNLKYYNGATVYPTQLLKTVNLVSQRYEFFAELLIRCLKSNHNYIEVPFNNKLNQEKSSKAISLQNFLSIFKTTCFLIRDIYIKRQPCGQRT